MVAGRRFVTWTVGKQGLIETGIVGAIPVFYREPYASGWIAACSWGK
jgi:hypothetical protein